MSSPLVPAAAGASTTTSSPYVTLQPTQHGQLPSDASDPADFYGLAAALVAIVLAVVVVRLVFRGRGGRDQEEERGG